MITESVIAICIDMYKERGRLPMEKKDIDWGNLGFGYVQTDFRYVSNYKNGAWDQGVITEDANIPLTTGILSTSVRT